MLGIRVVEANWQTHKGILRSIREQVFINEQKVPRELEWDSLDESCTHLIAIAGEDAIGCARLIKEGTTAKIGRMAVLKSYRGMGVGNAIMEFTSQLAKKLNLVSVSLSAQCHAFQFYHNLGYHAHSTAPYDDAGIPHVDMVKSLTPSAPTENKTGLYKLGDDSTHHQGNELLHAQGYLDLFLSQTQRAIILCVKDLHHPLCSYQPMFDKIKSLAKSKRYFKVYVLLNSYHRDFNQHPLVHLQKRLPSFIEIKKSASAVPTHWIFDATGWLDFDENESRANFSDRAHIRHFMDRFKLWWDHAHIIQEARDLHI